MYPELALALPFVFLGKMNFKTRLIFLCATLATAGVLVGFHIGRVSVEHELRNRWLDHSQRSGGPMEGHAGQQARSQRVEAKLAERRSNITSSEGLMEDLKARVREEAEEMMLRRGVKVSDQKREEETAEGDFPQPISLKPRQQPQLNKQGGIANQQPLPPGHHPSNQDPHPPGNHQAASNQEIRKREGQPKVNPPANQNQPVMNNQANNHPPANQKLSAVDAAKLAAAKAKGQHIHYAYEPFDILPEPEPLKTVGVDPVSDVFGRQLRPLNECIHLSVVVCGDRTEETLIMLKSSAVLTKACLVFHIFAEDDLQAGIRDLLNAWPSSFKSRVHFYIYPITFPSGENKNEWKKVFKLCATQRLFLPDLLPKVDSLLYVDTDILFIKPLEKIWHFFSRFNSTQMAALAPEHEVPNIGWYNRFARHPYYGKTGLNSGVMLMNLTRMREFRWINRIIPFYRQYRLKITWGDQDLINVLFYFHPDRVYEYPCEWNYRPDHCMYGNNCHRIETEGIAVIHGNRGVYHNDKNLPFRSIYETYRDFHLGGSISSDLIQPLKERWMNSNLINMYCTQAMRKPILSTLARYTQT